MPLKKKISLVLLGSFVFFIFLEAGLRFGGFVFVSFQEYRNARSLAKKGTYRILCLGESTTANQYPPFLEQILNQRHTGVRFSVIDKGVIATDTPAILRRLRENLAAYKPDMVVAMMGFNDRRVAYYADIPEVRMPLFQYCRTYRLLRLLYSLLIKKRHHAPQPQDTHADTALTEDTREHNELLARETESKRTIESDPQNEEAYIELGGSYRQQGKFSQAEESLRKAIELNPQNERAYVELGRLYRAAGRFSQAEDLYQKAIVLNPKNERIYIELGWLYRTRGKLSQAEAAFKKAIEANPRNERMYVELGWSYRTQGRFSQAEDLLKQAVALKPLNDDTYGDRAYGALSVLYEETGKPGLARAYAEKAEGLRSKTPNALTAQSYQRLKDILDTQGIRLVCVQYPMRNIGPLKAIFRSGQEGVVFVDNEKIFRDALKKDGYNAYFRDAFGGDFGHCTDKGNKLLAENIANAILKKVFHK
ncbi:MAG TPA: tetratricopeptide repeat protein [Patescibacteria group bacterium]|nr:tetratricopeptide repeat protein [Patescibacteria group bacterium]